MTNEEYQRELEIAFQVKEEIASLKAENKILKLFYEDFKQALILPVVVKPFNASFKIGDKVKFASLKCTVEFFDKTTNLYDLQRDGTNVIYTDIPSKYITESV